MAGGKLINNSDGNRQEKQDAPKRKTEVKEVIRKYSPKVTLSAVASQKEGMKERIIDLKDSKDKQKEQETDYSGLFDDLESKDMVEIKEKQIRENPEARAYVIGREDRSQINGNNYGMEHVCTGCGLCDLIKANETQKTDNVETTDYGNSSSDLESKDRTRDKNSQVKEIKPETNDIQNTIEIPIVKNEEKIEQKVNFRQDIQKEIKAIKTGEDTVSNVKSEFVQDDNATRTNPTNLSTLETNRIFNTKINQETESNSKKEIKSSNTPTVKTNVKTNDSDIKLQSFATNKKQTIIGDYTYEDILTIPWLRKLYGHLIGIIDIEEKEMKKEDIGIIPEKKKEEKKDDKDDKKPPKQGPKIKEVKKKEKDIIIPIAKKEEKTVGKLESKIEIKQKMFEATKKTKKKIETRIIKLAKKAKTIKKTLENEAKKIKKRISELEKIEKKLKQQLKKVKTKKLEIKNKIEKVRIEIKKLKKLKTNYEKLKKTLDKRLDKIKKLKKEVIKAVKAKKFSEAKKKLLKLGKEILELEKMVKKLIKLFKKSKKKKGKKKIKKKSRNKDKKNKHKRKKR